MTSLLSLCIPTWNRGRTLPALLESIAVQWRDGIEVVISDNASSDETRAIVTAFRKRYPDVVYRRSARNMGFDANLRTLVQTAKGRMCWFLGADDRVYSGAIARILDTMQNAPGAMIVGDVHTCINQTPVQIEESTAWPDYSAFWLDDPGTIARYLAKARTVRAAFPFIANVVFPRLAWPKEKEAMAWEGTSYTHVFAAWKMALEGVPVVTRRKVFVWAAISHPDRRDAETCQGVRHAIETVARVSRMVPPGKDRQALRRVWRFEYPEERIRSLHQRCRQEPAWAFTRTALERMVRGGVDR